MNLKSIKELKKTYQKSLKNNIALLPKDADKKKICWVITLTTFITDNPKDDILAERNRYVKMANKNFIKFKKDEQAKTKTSRK